MIDLSTLWRMPIAIRRVSADNTPCLLMRIELTPEKTVQKLMKMSPKFCTSIKHYQGRGFKKSTKLSDIRMKVYQLLICHMSVVLTPIEVEQDTESINTIGESEGCWTTYTYLLTMLQKFLTEVVNDNKTI